MRAFDTRLLLLARGDSILALKALDVKKIVLAEDGTWLLTCKGLDTLSAERARGARVYVAYSALADEDERADASALAAALPASWVETMPANVM